MTAMAPSNSRGMGWRKPVPIYVPTPPSSRPTSDTFTPAPVFSGGGAGKQLSAEGLPPVSLLLLPLPHYLWREQKANLPLFRCLMNG